MSEPTITFQAWPKTPRLNRDMIVTEKIDGTNAAVIVVPAPDGFERGNTTDDNVAVCVMTTHGLYLVAAQSRKRLVSPGKQTDNAGFAAWVRHEAGNLAEVLGEGYHYGEWWNAQAARQALAEGEKRFSLFNVNRYADVAFAQAPGLDLVPVLYEGPFSQARIEMLVAELREHGSKAHPGIPAEGVIVFHKAAGHVYKVLCHGDEFPKGVITAQEREVVHNTPTFEEIRARAA